MLFRGLPEGGELVNVNDRHSPTIRDDWRQSGGGCVVTALAPTAISRQITLKSRGKPEIQGYGGIGFKLGNRKTPCLKVARYRLPYLWQEPVIR